MSGVWLSSRRRSVLTVGGTVKVSGLAELEQNLMAIGRIAATKAGEEALLQSAAIVVGVAKVMAPAQEGGAGSIKSWHARTFWARLPGRKKKQRLKYEKPIHRSAYYGTIRSNLRATVVPSNVSAQVTVAVHTGDAFWALFVEGGTVVRHAETRGNANRGRMTPHPFLAPSLNFAAPFVLENLSRQLQHSIRRAARGLI